MPEGWYEDTDSAALEVFLRLHREMTPGERLARVFEMSAVQEDLQRASVRAMYPNDGWDPELHRRRLLARRCGRVIQLQSGRLDKEYLDRWAAELGVTDLLKGAFS